MFLKIWLNYIIGYVNIKVESYFLERFINICISKKILLWNIKREKSSILYASISVRDYKRLKGIVKKTKSKIKIESKKGLPFVLHKYRKRKIFFAFLVLIFLGLIVTSNFIWNVEIIGNININGFNLNLEQVTEDDITVKGKIESIDIERIIDEES